MTKRGEPPSTKVVDIVAMLQESLKQRGGKATAAPKELNASASAESS